MQKFKPGQKVTCNLVFIAKILEIHNDLKLIEFKSLNDGKRYMLTLDEFGKLAQTKH